MYREDEMRDIPLDYKKKVHYFTNETTFFDFSVYLLVSVRKSLYH